MQSQQPGYHTDSSSVMAKDYATMSWSGHREYVQRIRILCDLRQLLNMTATALFVRDAPKYVVSTLKTHDRNDQGDCPDLTFQSEPTIAPRLRMYNLSANFPTVQIDQVMPLAPGQKLDKPSLQMSPSLPKRRRR